MLAVFQLIPLKSTLDVLTCLKTLHMILIVETSYLPPLYQYYEYHFPFLEDPLPIIENLLSTLSFSVIPYKVIFLPLLRNQTYFEILILV